jgi:hypothetical protein
MNFNFYEGVILSARGPERFLGVPEERFVLFGAEFGGGK